MKGSDRGKKKSYSLFYRIYRRIRYLRHIRRKKKSSYRQIKQQVHEEQRLLRENLREHVRQLREEERDKQKYERDRQKKEQEEIRSRLKRQSSLSEEIQKDETREVRLRKKREMALLKKKRRRLVRYALRIQARKVFRSIRDFRMSDISNYFWKNRQPIRNFIRIALNSTTLFLLSYLSMYLLTQGVTVLAANLFHYPTILYYHEVFFNISVEDWYHDSVKTIFSAGPLVALLAGIAGMILFNNRKESRGLFKLFFLWAFLHGISMFFGAMLVGTLFERGIGHVISWMYIMDTGKLLYSIISIFMLVMAGTVSIKPFLLSGNTYFRNMTRRNRRSFIWAQVVLPFTIGTGLLVMLRMPHFMFYETFVTLTISVSLVPLLTAYPAYPDLYFEEEQKTVFFDWRYFLALAVVILFYRGVLQFGISIPA